MNIEFGCGDNPLRKDYKTSDIRDIPGVDFACPAWDIDNYVELNSVDIIFSRHMFEHLTFAQGKKTLETWYKILKPGGMVEMSLPNMDFHVNQWIKGKDMEHALAGFWGWQREGETDVWDVHKSGYNEKTLKTLVEQHNFKKYKRLPTKPKHLWVTFIK